MLVARSSQFAARLRRGAFEVERAAFVEVTRKSGRIEFAIEERIETENTMR